MRHDLFLCSLPLLQKAQLLFGQPPPNRRVAMKRPTLINGEQKILRSEGQWLCAANQKRCMKLVKATPPISYQYAPNEVKLKDAVMLIMLCKEDKNHKLSLLFIRRSARVRRHKLEISFPGGNRHRKDRDNVACALREIKEKLGLRHERVDVWGEGNVVREPNTAAIIPVIGVVRHFDVEKLSLNRRKVESAFTIPIAVLIEHSTIRYTQFRRGYSMPVFIVGPHYIWGVTGYFTYLFLSCLVPVEQGGLPAGVKYVMPYQGRSW